MGVQDTLLAAARNYLDITWEDTAGDTKLSGILLRGMTFINNKAGAAQDYWGETAAKALLLDYVRYAMANALQDFPNDFTSELLSLRIMSEVAIYETNTIV